MKIYSRFLKKCTNDFFIHQHLFILELTKNIKWFSLTFLLWHSSIWRYSSNQSWWQGATLLLYFRFLLLLMVMFQSIQYAHIQRDVYDSNEGNIFINYIKKIYTTGTQYTLLDKFKTYFEIVIHYFVLLYIMYSTQI